jgi:uncharacterized protein involved in type VI secretion and phage assembly
MGLLDLLSDDTSRQLGDSHRVGLVRGEVLDNLDLTGQGRVQVRIPSIPDIEPWAAVCAPFAGNGYGLWCIPQVGDIVVVGFENGDIAWPVVVGSVWDLRNRPPVDLPTDAVGKRVLKTPAGHQVVLDDTLQKIELIHLAGHTLTIDADGITLELAQGLGSVKVQVPGTLTVSTAVSADLSSKKTSVEGTATLDLSGAATSLQADATCQIKGGLVTIN